MLLEWEKVAPSLEYEINNFVFSTIPNQTLNRKWKLQKPNFKKMEKNAYTQTLFSET